MVAPTFSHTNFRTELAAFKTLLDSKVDLDEATDLLPFFKSSKNTLESFSSNGFIYLRIKTFFLKLKNRVKNEVVLSQNYLCLSVYYHLILTTKFIDIL